MLAWLSGALPGDRVAAAAPLSGGYGNENILVTTGRGRCVLRRYRRGGGRDAARTCAVEAALASRLAGTPVPVPEVIAADPAGSVTGEPLLLTRYVAGVTVAAAIGRDSGPESGPAAQAMTRAGDGAGRRPARATAEPDRSQAAQIGAAAGRALAAVGMVTFERAGVFTGADLVPSDAGWPDSLPEFVENCVRAGPAASALSGAELRQLRALAVRSDPLARRVASSRQLVHSDYNGKNLLAVRRDGQWSISAVLDWEFAFSGSPLTDIGNMLRFGDEYPPGFAGSFIAGYQEAGGHLPPDWREISAALDLYALADFLTRPPLFRQGRDRDQETAGAALASRPGGGRHGGLVIGSHGSGVTCGDGAAEGAGLRCATASPQWLPSRNRTRLPCLARSRYDARYGRIVQPDHSDPVRRRPRGRTRLLPQAGLPRDL